VPEAAAFRVELLASHRAQRLRAAARSLTIAAAVACTLAALLAPSPLSIAATLASIGAAVLSFRPGRDAAVRPLAIRADGKVGAGDQPAAVRYCGRQLVCLQAPGRLLAVWPEVVSATDWRRLLVACRWQRRPGADDRATVSGLRTK